MLYLFYLHIKKWLWLWLIVLSSNTRRWFTSKSLCNQSATIVRHLYVWCCDWWINAELVWNIVYCPGYWTKLRKISVVMIQGNILISKYRCWCTRPRLHPLFWKFEEFLAIICLPVASQKSIFDHQKPIYLASTDLPTSRRLCQSENWEYLHWRLNLVIFVLVIVAENTNTIIDIWRWITLLVI